MKKNVKGLAKPILGLAALFFVSVQFISCKENDSSSHAGDSPVAAPTSKDSLLKTYQDKCAWIDELAKKYRAKVDSRIQGLKNKNISFMDSLPIEVFFGDTYMQSFRNNLSGPWSAVNTHVITISVEEIAFFIDYLYTHRNEPGISLGLARYDRTLLGNNRDPDLEDNPSYDRRYTVIAGLVPSARPPRGSRPRPNARGEYLAPFTEGNKSFYNDWHEIWP